MSSNETSSVYKLPPSSSPAVTLIFLSNCTIAPFFAAVIRPHDLRVKPERLLRSSCSKCRKHPRLTRRSPAGSKVHSCPTAIGFLWRAEPQHFSSYMVAEERCVRSSSIFLFRSNLGTCVSNRHLTQWNDRGQYQEQAQTRDITRKRDSNTDRR